MSNIEWHILLTKLDLISGRLDAIAQILDRAFPETVTISGLAPVEGRRDD